MKLIILLIALIAMFSSSADAVYFGLDFEQVSDNNSVTPNISISGTSNITNNQTVSLTANSTYCSTCVPFYSWGSDGGSFSGTLGGTSVVWTPPKINSTQTYTISSTIGDGKGHTATASFPVTVTPNGTACTSTVATPTLFDPGLWTEMTTLYISWQTINNSSAYIFQESTSPSFSSYNQYSYDQNTLNAVLSNRANDTYYYRVKAQNACGSSGWSNTVDLEVRANLPPSTPSGPSPTNGASNIGRTPYLTWTGGDSDGSADYAVEIGTDPDPNNFWYIQGYNSANRYNNSLQISWSLKASTTYYWRVRSVDDKGAVSIGPVWSFITSSQSADLVATAIDAVGTVANGQQVTVNVTVQNQGNFVADGGTVNYYYSTFENGKQNEFRYAWRGVPQLNPGESATISTNIVVEGLQAGFSYIVADVVPFVQVLESDLSNNTISYPISYTDTSGPTINFFAFQGSSSGQYRTYNQYYITYTATDDIKTSSVNLDYSTDNGSTWNAITSNFPVLFDATGNGFYWTIPGTVPVNSIFKMRITAFDAAGNSTSNIIGPYTIIDGSTPAVTITSPAKGTLWKLGETKNITWNATSPNGIKRVYITYSNVGSIVDLSTNTGSYSWTIPTSADYASNNSTIKIYVEDNNGNGIWTTSDQFQMVDVTAPPLPPWGMPEKVTTVTPVIGHSLTNHSPAIAVDSQGNQHLVYVYQDDNVSSSRVMVDSLIYMKKTGSAWSQPIILKSIPNGPSTTGIDGFIFISDISIKVDSNGQPHVTWKEASTSLSKIYYSYNNGSSWTTPKLVSDNKAAKLKITIYNNNVDLFWAENLNVNPEQIYTRSFNTSNGIWGTPAKIAETNHSDSIFDVTRVGATLHVCYQFYSGGYKIGHISNDGSGWSMIHEVIPSFNNYKYYDDLSLFADAQGIVHLSGRTLDAVNLSKRIVFYSSLVNGYWAEMESAYSSTESIGYTKVHADQFGTPNILFSMSLPTSSIKYIQRKNDGLWSTGTSAILTSQSLDSYRIASAVNPALTGLYIPYTSFTSGYWEVFVNSANLTVDFIPPTITYSNFATGTSVNGSSTIPINWQTTDDKGVTSVTLKYSTDNGATFNTISTNQAASGSYLWTVPNINAGSVQIYLEAYDVALNVTQAISNTFSINYVQIYSLAITKNGTGTGTVSSNPAGINCGATCSSNFMANTSVSLTAIPADGNRFTGWSGACQGTGSCNILIDSAKSVTAGFELVPIDGTCGNSNGMSLTAAPTTGLCAYGGGTPTSVVGIGPWNWICQGSNGGGSVMCTANKVFQLTLIVGGTGYGTLTSVPSGISCTSGTCQATFDPGTSVEILETPDALTSVFAGWTGACTGVGTCNTIMDTAKSITATFNLTPRIKLDVLSSTGFDTLAEAYLNASGIIYALQSEFSENWTLGDSKNITLQGGYFADFGPTRNGFTILNGKLTIGAGSLTVERLLIR